MLKDKDGNWYWTLNGSLLLDNEGNPIRANGWDGEKGDEGDKGDQGDKGDNAPTPQISLGKEVTGTIVTDNGAKDDNAVYLSVDNGETWYRISGDKGDKGDKGDTGATGDKGEQGEQGEQGPIGPQGPQGETGKAWFSNVKLSSDGLYYEFTLEGDKEVSFRIPAYQPLTIGEGTGTLTIVSGKENPIQLYFEGNYEAIVAQIIQTDDDIAIDTRADNGWKVTADLDAKTVTVTAPADGKALLDVSLIRADGSKVTASRVLEAVTTVTAEMTEITTGGNYLLTGSRSNTLTIKGTDINLTLDDATINVSSGPAINITGGNPTIHVIGANNTVSTSDGAGIYVAPGSSVTIEGNSRENDILEAHADRDGAGIGGSGWENYTNTCGDIIIRNVTVKAYGHGRMLTSPGIGSYGTCGNISIDNALVYAHGGLNDAPAIGSKVGDIPTITINSSVIHAYRGGFDNSSPADWIGKGSYTADGIHGDIRNSIIHKFLYDYFNQQTIAEGTVEYDANGNVKEQ